MTNTEQKNLLGKIKVPQEYHNRINTLRKNKPAFIGLSIGKKEFMDIKVMNAYASYLHENFPYSLIIVADTLKRHNIEAIDGICEKEALRRATIAGDDLFRFIEKITRHLYNVKASRWQDLAQGVIYENELELLRQSYEESIHFREDVKMEARKFLEQPANILKIQRHSTLDDAIFIAKNYVLEELALTSAIPKISGYGPWVEIYPGKMELQNKLYSGYYKAILGDTNSSLAEFSGRISFATVPIEAYYEPSN